MSFTGLEKHSMNKWTGTFIKINLSSPQYSLVSALLYDDCQERSELSSARSERARQLASPEKKNCFLETEQALNISAIIHNALVRQGAYFFQHGHMSNMFNYNLKKKQQQCFRKVKSCIIMRFTSTKARINGLKRKEKQTASELKSMFCKLGSNCAIHGENGGK